MVLRYFYNCFCPRVMDEDETTRDNSDDRIATILPFDFIPESEFNHHPVEIQRSRISMGAGAPIPVRATPPSPSATHHAILLMLQMPIIPH